MVINVLSYSQLFKYVLRCLKSYDNCQAPHPGLNIADMSCTGTDIEATLHCITGNTVQGELLISKLVTSNSHSLVHYSFYFYVKCFKFPNPSVTNADSSQ